MKVRVYYPYFPYPTTEGSFQIAFEHLRVFKSRGEKVELVVWLDGPRDVEDKRSRPSVVPFDFDVPVFFGKKTGTGLINRLWRVLVSLFSDYASPELFYYFPNQIDLEPADLEIYEYSFAHSWLKSVQRRAGSKTKRVVVFHNLESELFEERARNTSFLPARLFHYLNAKKLKRHEAELATLADELWFISPQDLVRYRARTDASNARLVPPSYSPVIRTVRNSRFVSYLDRIREQDRELNLGFLGGMGFGPNRDSALWILDKLCPLLESRGFNGNVLFVGSGAGEDIVAKAKRYPFVKMLGFVADLEEFWSSISFMLVPHVSGSGVRIKLLEALASGVPVLATHEAVKRIDSRLHQSPLLFESDDPVVWVTHILQNKPFEIRLRNMTDLLPAGMDGSGA